QVLAPPVDGRDRCTGERVLEVAPAAVPADDAHRVLGVANLDGADLPANDLLLQLAADDLHLRQFGHQASLAPSRAPSRPPSRDWISARASRAASCSASFFERPLPSPSSSPAR